MKRVGKTGRKSQIPEAKQLAIIAQYHQGLSVKEIAQTHSLHSTTVKNIIRKGQTGRFIFALELENEYHRKLYGNLLEYAKECGLTLKQLLWLLVIKELNRAGRGE